MLNYPVLSTTLFATSIEDGASNLTGEYLSLVSLFRFILDLGWTCRGGLRVG
jgi:hypothetical protein